MSMHLCGPGLSTTSTKQRKKKPAVITAKIAEEFRQYNKHMRKIGCKTKTVDEYMQYRQGKLKYTPKAVIKDPFAATTLRRESPKVESGIGIGVGGYRKENVYTGTLIKGIATMHKSNAVPIINQEQAVEISQMRRN